MANILTPVTGIKEAVFRKHAAVINLLDDLVTDFVADYNFKKYLRPEGSLQFLLGYDVNKPIGTLAGIPLLWN